MLLNLFKTHVVAMIAEKREGGEKERR